MKLDSIVVSDDSYNSSDKYDIIYSNICYLNYLFERHVRVDEACDEALKSYFVDYYLAQLNNGGFSQFIFNCKCDESTLGYVEAGLRDMGADKHLGLFKKSVGLLAEIGQERVNIFLQSQYFGENAERDALNTFDDEFYRLEDECSLIDLNHHWLKQHSKLLVLSIKRMEKQVDLIVKAIPDLAERKARRQ